MKTNNWRLYVALAVLGFVALKGGEWYQRLQPAVPMASVVGPAAVQCEVKPLCITVYVAPWCGACKMSQPTFQALNAYLPRHRKDVGFRIVVGGASPNEHHAEQKLLSPIQSFADDRGELMRRFGVQAFPTWIVSDPTGKVVSRKAGGLQISGDAELEALLSQFLQI